MIMLTYSICAPPFRSAIGSEKVKKVIPFPLYIMALISRLRLDQRTPMSLSTISQIPLLQPRGLLRNISLNPLFQVDLVSLPIVFFFIVISQNRIISKLKKNPFWIPPGVARKIYIFRRKAHKPILPNRSLRPSTKRSRRSFEFWSLRFKEKNTK